MITYLARVGRNFFQTNRLDGFYFTHVLNCVRIEGRKGTLFSIIFPKKVWPHITLIVRGNKLLVICTLLQYYNLHSSNSAKIIVSNKDASRKGPSLFSLRYSYPYPLRTHQRRHLDQQCFPGHISRTKGFLVSYIFLLCSVTVHNMTLNSFGQIDMILEVEHHTP